MRRASITLPSRARDARDEPRADEAAEAAEQQRQRRQQRAELHARAARLPQVGRQPGDVEIPAVRQERVLKAEQPDRAVAQQAAPGHGRADRRVGRRRQQRQFGRR